MDDEVKELFMNYSWDGNVRELSNTIESMVTSLSGNAILTKNQIPRYLLERMGRENSESGNEKDIESDSLFEKLDFTSERNKNCHIAYHDVMEAVEKKMVRRALEMAGGNKTKAGEILGLPRKTLVYRMERLGIK